MDSGPSPRLEAGRTPDAVHASEDLTWKPAPAQIPRLLHHVSLATRAFPGSLLVNGSQTVACVRLSVRRTQARTAAEAPVTPPQTAAAAVAPRGSQADALAARTPFRLPPGHRGPCTATVLHATSHLRRFIFASASSAQRLGWTRGRFTAHTATPSGSAAPSAASVLRRGVAAALCGALPLGSALSARLSLALCTDSLLPSYLARIPCP